MKSREERRRHHTWMWVLVWIITVLGIIGFVGYRNGWFSEKKHNKGLTFEQIDSLAEIESEQEFPSLPPQETDTVE